MEKFQHALLISLIVILGVIMYLRFIRNSKNKRLSADYSFIEGYNKTGEQHVITYNIGRSEDTEMVIMDLDGKELCNARIIHEKPGTFKAEFKIPNVNSEYVILIWNTKNQKISKKIYVNI